MDKILKQEIERTKKVKQEYFDRPEVTFFAKTVSGLFDVRQSIEEQSNHFLNHMFAIGRKEWWDNAPRDRSFFKASSKRRAVNIAEYIVSASFFAVEPYYIIRQYFELFYGPEDEAELIKMMAKYIQNHSREIMAITKQLFPCQDKIRAGE